MTVVRAIRAALPGEAIVYLGDTARVPYGTKSPDTVRTYARQNTAFLLDKGVKAVVAACNTVSAVALPEVESEAGVPVLGVVEWGALNALARHPHRVGVIGTATTIGSGAYERAIARIDASVEVLTQACPLFVPLIEEGWWSHAVTDAVIAEYLTPMRESGIDVLLLGCTHYPLIRSALERFFGDTVDIVDSAESMARALGAALERGEFAPSGLDASGALERSHYYVTDRCNHFQKLVTAFMCETKPAIESIPIEQLLQVRSAS
jgi:glutamate racemase